MLNKLHWKILGIAYLGMQFCACNLVADVTPKVLWQFNVQGGVESAPAVSPDGTIYVSSADNHLWAINSDGTKKWAQPFSVPLTLSPIVNQNNGNVLVAVNGPSPELGGLFAFLPSGKPLWHNSFYFPVNPPSASITFTQPENINNNSVSVLVYPQEAGDPSFPILAQDVDFNTGKTLFVDPIGQMIGWDDRMWTIHSPSETANNFWFTPICERTEESRNIYYFNNTTSKYGSIPSTPTPTLCEDGIEVYSNVTIDPNGTTLYFTDISGDVYKYSETPTEIWKDTFAGDMTHTRPLVDKNTDNLFVASSNGFVYSLAPDATKNWSTFVNNSGITGNLALGTNGHLYGETNNNEIFAIDTKTGTLLWQQQFNAHTAPVVGITGDVYFGTGDGTIMAIEDNN